MAQTPSSGSYECSVEVKAWATAEDALWSCVMYLHTHSEVQVPWDWMSWMDTLWLKAQVAPERRSVWKVIFVFCRCRRLRILWNAFLRAESVRGNHFEAFLIWKRGELLVPGVMARSVWRAEYGQITDLPNLGIVRSLIVSLDWSVLDHFMRILAWFFVKNMSALESCSQVRKWGNGGRD